MYCNREKGYRGIKLFACHQDKLIERCAILNNVSLKYGIAKIIPIRFDQTTILNQRSPIEVAATI